MTAAGSAFSDTTALIWAGIIMTGVSVVAKARDEYARKRLHFRITADRLSIPVLDDVEQVIDQVVQGIRDELLGALDQTPRPPLLALSHPEQRSPEQYRGQVEEYLDALPTALRELLHSQYVAEQHGPLQLRISSDGAGPFEKVRVTLRLPPGITVLDPDELDTPNEVAFPEQPKPYGKGGSFLSMPSIPGLTSAFTPVDMPPDIDIIDHADGSTTVTYPDITVRPDDRNQPMEVLYLYSSTNTNNDMRAHIEASSGVTGTPDTVTKSFTLRVGEPVPADALLKRALRTVAEED
ncbi:hypothetical protein FHS23_004592 [Prauserella isguenensis]|uniref:Uncharacterized protein n=1 Tax=Prauserella isguenensis TaxID=1470180 RepID=A0A839S787_9PSEU|nr:hypothetical protein [Prauserella isguenensis]MBB3053538.1 hypothetical protein [Prauserella isguenensis]